jgi:hypothetical protein
MAIIGFLRLPIVLNNRRFWLLGTMLELSKYTACQLTYALILAQPFLVTVLEERSVTMDPYALDEAEKDLPMEELVLLWAICQPSPSDPTGPPFSESIKV